MKIAVYPGSFNPMHIGHIAVIGYLLGHSGFDKVYLVVSPHNPFKDRAIKDNADMRLQAARQAIERHGLGDRVLVDDIEFGRPSPSYTIDTLDALKRREPGNSFTLVIGGDNVEGMPRWKEGERLLTEYGVAVYPREGHDMVREANKLKLQHKNAEKLFSPGCKHRPYRIRLLREAPFITVSSTRIREMLSRGEDVTALLA